jgi:hypothetical protein
LLGDQADRLASAVVRSVWSWVNRPFDAGAHGLVGGAVGDVFEGADLDGLLGVEFPDLQSAKLH